MLVVLRVFVAVGVATLFSIGLVFLARLTQKRHSMRGTDDVETAYVTSVSTLYGIFVAFMIFTVWNQYNEAKDAAAAEANSIAEVYQLAGGLDDPLKVRVRNLALKYAHSVIDYEWNTMRKGESSPRTQQIVNAMWILLNRMGPDIVKDSVLHDHLLTAWSKTGDVRRLRLEWSSSGLSSPAYALLIVGGLITIGLACLFTTDDFLIHVIKASAISVMIVMMLVTIWGLDHPYSSNVRIKPIPLTRMMEMLPTVVNDSDPHVGL